MLKRRRIDVAQARAALALYQQIPIQLIEINVDAALTLAGNLGIYAYDAYILAAAISEGSPLLTLDNGLIHAAKQAGVVVLEVKR